MPEIREAVIVEAVRTPIGKRDGSLKGIHPVDLLAEALKEAVNRAGVEGTTTWMLSSAARVRNRSRRALECSGPWPS